MSDDQLDEIDRKLEDMREDLNDIQGDVNILSTLNKERHRDDIINLIQDKFGRSEVKRLCWYYANGERDPQEIIDKTGRSSGSVYPALTELDDQGLLKKREANGTVYYDKTEITVGIGLPSKIEDKIDDL